MAPKDLHHLSDENKLGKLNHGAATPTTNVSTHSFANGIACAINSPWKAQTDQKGVAKTDATTSETRSPVQVSGLISKIALDKWDSMLPPLASKPTIESILSEDPTVSSRQEEIKGDLNQNSAYVGYTAVQNPAMIYTAPTNSAANQNQGLTGNSLPYYNWMSIDNRVLSTGAVLISEAPMEDEYNELWNETCDLLDSEAKNLGR